MHELTLAQSIIESATAAGKANGASKIHRITVEVGSLSGIIKESLEFCFPLAAEDTPLKDCKLDIIEVPLKVRCQSCQKESLPEKFHIRCHHCESTDVEIIAGKDFRLINLEVD